MTDQTRVFDDADHTTGQEPLLKVRGLAVDFQTTDGVVHAVEDVDIDILPGETVAIVGESGSGKSTTAMAVIGLLAKGGKVAKGRERRQREELPAHRGRPPLPRAYAVRRPAGRLRADPGQHA